MQAVIFTDKLKFSPFRLPKGDFYIYEREMYRIGTSASYTFNHSFIYLQLTLPNTV